MEEGEYIFPNGARFVGTMEGLPTAAVTTFPDGKYL